MAQTYTIEESAARLGIPLEEFKRRWKTEWSSVRTFRDGGTVRFRSADIDELARTLGMASDPGLQMAPPGKDRSSTEFLLPDDNALDDDIFTLSASDSGKKKGKPADSDIRLEMDSSKSGRRKNTTDGTPTEELALDLGPPSSSTKKRSGNSSAKLSAPKTGPKLNKDDDSSSEFELSLDADSDSFELNLNPDGSDEVDLGGSRVGKRGGASGINLAKPADSGISLENDSDELELSLDEEHTSASGRKLTGPKSVKMPKLAADSDSEFELTLDDNSGLTDALAEEAGKGESFETDYQLSEDDSESGSEVVAVDSDTDLEDQSDFAELGEDALEAEDESASAVISIDDEDLAPAKARAGKSGKRRSVAAVEYEEDIPIDLEDDDASSEVGSAMRGTRGRRDMDEEDEVDLSSKGYYKPQPWGPLPAIVLLPAFILTFLGGVMSYELLRGMWGYSAGTKPAGSLVRGVADMIDMKPAD